MTASSGSTVVTSAAGTLGTGNVTINDTSKLTIGVADSLADSATLTLGAATAGKLTMNADDAVNALFIGTVQLPAGNYTSDSGSWLTGAGRLTVTLDGNITLDGLIFEAVNGYLIGDVAEDNTLKPPMGDRTGASGPSTRTSASTTAGSTSMREP